VAKLLWTVVFASFAFYPALTQDAAKVEPKHYKLAFENDKVQVLYVHYGPHEKSKLHSHPQGVVVALTASHLLFTDQNGKTQEVYSKAGEARWFPAVQHAVENLGDEAFSAVYIGIRGGPSTGGSARQLPQIDEQTAQILSAYMLNADSVQQVHATASEGDGSQTGAAVKKH
jgi:quercetin dioxygenase-like cupin family protein